MNIISKPELAKQVRREYEHLIRSESHEYAVLWVSIKLHVSVEEVRQIIDEVTA